MILITLFISFFILNDGDKITMKSKPLKKDAIKLTNMKKFMPEEGFYKYTLSTIAPNGKLICYDAGNIIVNIFDKEGNLEYSFGKEGTGPGEFAPNYIWRILASDKYIYTQQWDKLMVFDYSGKLINETKGIEYFQKSILQIKDNQLITLFHKTPYRKYLKVIFSETGKIIKKVMNPDRNNVDVFKDPSKFYSELHSTPRSRLEKNQVYIEPDIAEYKIYFYDLNRKLIRTIDRPFVRESFDPEQMWYSKTDGLTKRQAASRMATKKAINSVLNGKRAAISGILGFLGDYLFLSVRPEDKKGLILDVISPNNLFYTQLVIEDDEIQYVSIINGKLIASCSNDDDGPYIKTYDIEIK